MEPIQKNQCTERVADSVSFHRCRREGIIERAGKWYCKQHDPVAVAERRASQNAKWEAEWAAKSKQYDRERLTGAIMAPFATEALEAHRDEIQVAIKKIVEEAK